MLAALVALYREPGTAPRPLWLDEAFTGVDDANRATMLALLVTFDLDFLLAGPATLVTTAQVPSAAVWFINRAPAPDPGVDLSLLLWSGDASAGQPTNAADPDQADPDQADPDKADHTGLTDLTDHSDFTDHDRTEQPLPRVIP